MDRHSPLIPLLAAAQVMVGCASDPAAPAFSARVVSVVPSGGAVGVDPSAPIVITFSHPMQPGMEQFAALHEGDVRGPVVTGAWMWSADRTTLRFTPTSPLGSQTQYTLHLGGGMRAMDGGYVDFGPCVEDYRGRWVTGEMMGGGMRGGGAMMGAGWRHPNGTYGMVFSFTTS